MIVKIKQHKAMQSSVLSAYLLVVSCAAAYSQQSSDSLCTANTMADTTTVAQACSCTSTSNILINQKPVITEAVVREPRFPAPVPKTGQTNEYQAGDDGTHQKGLAWPNPRFTVGTGTNGTNCVTDNMTGLIWAKNANLAGMPMTWSDAVAYCRGLKYSGYSDWRLPNRRELLSLVDDGRFNPALCNTAGTGQWKENDPFTGVESDYYWSSSTIPDITGYSWFVFMYAGYVSLNTTTSVYYVWPVRGGQ